MKRIFLLVQIMALACFLGAQFEDEPVLDFTLSPSPLEIQSGDTAEITARVKLFHPWHINSMTPGDDSFIPTTFTIDHPDLTLEKISAPKHKLMTFSFSPEPMAVYEGTVSFTLTLRHKGTASGPPEAPIVLGYQACNNSVCLPPKEETRRLSLSISGATGEAAGETGGSVSDLMSSRGFLVTLLLLFLGGLALNLTPCVYPMIPITLGFFTMQSREDSRAPWGLAFLYFLGITVVYSSLGTMASMTGKLFGNLLQSPAVLVSVAVILFILSLSMFDLYKLQLPPALTSRLSGRAGYVGAFLMGALVGLVAAPCIGPIVLGLITYVASRGEPLTGFIMFFTLSAGLGLPYLILGMFTGSMKKLPHSGVWMATIERVFGFLLLAAAVYIIRPILPTGMETLLYSALAFTCGTVLLLFMPTAGESGAWRWVRRILSTASILLAFALLLPLVQKQPEPGLFNPYSDAGLKRSFRENRPVIIDFSAEWCQPCKEMEHKTFSRPEIRELMSRFTLLKADLTKDPEPEVKAIVDKYHVTGVPTIVFLSGSGRELKDLGFVGFIGPDEFKKKLQSALAVKN